MAGAGLVLGIAARLRSAQQPGAASRKHCLGAGEICSKGLMEELYFIAFAFNSSSAEREQGFLLQKWHHEREQAVKCRTI